MKGQIIVLGTNHWNMVEEKKEGVSVMYLNENPETAPNKKGYIPMKESFNLETVAPLFGCEFPQKCEVDISITSGPKGMKVNIMKFTPLGKIDLWK